MSFYDSDLITLSLLLNPSTVIKSAIHFLLTGIQTQWHHFGNVSYMSRSNDYHYINVSFFLPWCSQNEIILSINRKTLEKYHFQLEWGLLLKKRFCFQWKHFFFFLRTAPMIKESILYVRWPLFISNILPYAHAACALWALHLNTSIIQTDVGRCNIDFRGIFVFTLLRHL